VGVSQSDLDLIRGWGRRTEGLVSQRAGLLDWLAETVGGNNVSTEVDIIPGNYNYVYGKITHHPIKSHINN